MITIGIDPGKHGAIVALDNGTVASAHTMPLDDSNPTGIDWRSIADELFSLIHHGPPISVWIEHVSTMPNDGRVSAFSFGARFGGLIAVCLALHVTPHLVRPQVWKREILGRGWHTKADSTRAAARLPSITPDYLIPERCRKPHDGIAEAALIAMYGARRSPQDAQGSKTGGVKYPRLG